MWKLGYSSKRPSQARTVTRPGWKYRHNGSVSALEQRPWPRGSSSTAGRINLGRHALIGQTSHCALGMRAALA